MSLVNIYHEANHVVDYMAYMAFDGDIGIHEIIPTDQQLWDWLWQDQIGQAYPRLTSI